MDFGPNFQNNPQYQQYEQYPQTPSDKRSRGMAVAAAILSVISISTVCCIYVSFVCGILSIIFALLSKGGEMTMSPNARTALWVSVFSVFLTAALTAISVITVMVQYGGFEEFLKTYMEMMELYSNSI